MTERVDLVEIVERLAQIRLEIKRGTVRVRPGRLSGLHWQRPATISELAAEMIWEAQTPFTDDGYAAELVSFDRAVALCIAGFDPATLRKRPRQEGTTCLSTSR